MSNCFAFIFAKLYESVYIFNDQLVSLFNIFKLLEVLGNNQGLLRIIQCHLHLLKNLLSLYMIFLCMVKSALSMNSETCLLSLQLGHLVFYLIFLSFEEFDLCI